MSRDNPSPEARQREAFLSRVLETRTVYTVWSEGGLARVPSRRIKGRDVTLLWSRPEDANRWAQHFAIAPHVKAFALAELLAAILPRLHDLKRLIGVDWGEGRPEPEADANDIAERLRVAALDRFAARVRASGRVWTIEDANGPAFVVSETRPDMLVLPCWADRETAEMRIIDRSDGPWREMEPIENPLSLFVERRLPFLASQNRLIAPEHMEGAGALELEPGDLAGMLRNEGEGA